MRARSGVCVRPVPFNEPQDKTVAEPEHEEIDEGETDRVSSFKNRTKCKSSVDYVCNTDSGNSNNTSNQNTKLNETLHIYQKATICCYYRILCYLDGTDTTATITKTNQHHWYGR